MCIIFHKYKIISAKHWRGENLLGHARNFTIVLKECRECGKTKVEEIQGIWKIEELTPKQ